MRDHRRQTTWILLLGSVLAAGLQAVPLVAVGAEADGGFTLYAPSGSKQRLLVVRARPAAGDDKGGVKGGVTLELTRTVDLGFPGDTIAAHPTLPVLYVSGGQQRSIGRECNRRNGRPIEIEPAQRTRLRFGDERIDDQHDDDERRCTDQHPRPTRQAFFLHARLAIRRCPARAVAAEQPIG